MDEGLTPAECQGAEKRVQQLEKQFREAVTWLVRSHEEGIPLRKAVVKKGKKKENVEL